MVRPRSARADQVEGLALHARRGRNRDTRSAPRVDVAAGCGGSHSPFHNGGPGATRVARAHPLRRQNAYFFPSDPANRSAAASWSSGSSSTGPCRRAYRYAIPKITTISENENHLLMWSVV